MASIGQIILVLGLLFSVAAPITLFAGHRVSRKGAPSGERFTNAGYLFVFAATLCLSLCLALLIYCFFAGNYSIIYVAENHSNDVSGLAWLYKLAGLWSGREGSLLFWAWLISLFTSYVGMRRMTVTDELSNIALAVASIVLAAFLCVITFSTANNPFQATPASYLDQAGNLVGMASYWGMNVLLEHWAMTIHPPTLFIGYAGFTIPFAYAIAALVVNDPSKKWVELCSRITVFSWLFLGIGIGLGAVWAYVVLGWGGYWGWDPVENASLLPWLVGVALIHSFTIYRKRGGFKRWAVMCACICFSAVILGTFITRSGLVESVHAFEGDPVSLIFFLALITLSLIAGCIGIIVRRKDFEASEEIESLTSKNAAYYFNNVLMIASAAILAYLTISSALPAWLPFGGKSLSAGTYDAIARPLGILYCFIMAVCPLLVWGRTEGKEFRSRIKWPAVFAVVVFAGFLAIFITQLYPIYNATIAAGGVAASNLSADGPAWYYNGLAVVALMVAAAILCNTVYLFVRGVSARKKNKGESIPLALLNIFKKSNVQSGGYVAHLGIAIILVGLIGSSMYVSETAINIKDEVGATITNEHYVLEYRGLESTMLENGNQIDTATFVVYDDKGNEIGELTPNLQYVMATNQQKLNAAVISEPLRDLFVVYQGITTDGKLSMDVKVNPLISWVWAGFALLMIGIAIALIPANKKPRAEGQRADTE